MSEEKVGVKETKEALLGLMALLSAMADSFKDGVQATDISIVIAKMTQEPLKGKILAAYNGIDQVPSEAKDLELMEVISLLPEVMPEFIALMKAIKK